MGNDRDRNDHGRYNDRIDPETVLDLFDARDDRARPLTASDVVDKLGIARRTAHNKLNALVERGVLETRKVGARGRVWWTPIPDEETPPAERRRERNETAIDDDAGETTAERTPAGEGGATTRDTPESDPAESTIDGILDGWRPGRSLEKREQQHAAGRATLEYLRDRGEAQASEFKQDVEPEHAVDGQSPSTWWKKTARPVLKRAQEADVVEFQDGVKLWRWVGEE